MRDFNAIDAENQPRNIAAWSPVVADILRGCNAFEDGAVSLDFLLRLENRLS